MAGLVRSAAGGVHNISLKTGTGNIRSGVPVVVNVNGDDYTVGTGTYSPTVSVDNLSAGNIKSGVSCQPRLDGAAYGAAVVGTMSQGARTVEMRDMGCNSWVTVQGSGSWSGYVTLNPGDIVFYNATSASSEDVIMDVHGSYYTGIQAEFRASNGGHSWSGSENGVDARDIFEVLYHNVTTNNYGMYGSVQMGGPASLAVRNKWSSPVLIVYFSVLPTGDRQAACVGIVRA